MMVLCEQDGEFIIFGNIVVGCIIGVLVEVIIGLYISGNDNFGLFRFSEYVIVFSKTCSDIYMYMLYI